MLYEAQPAADPLRSILRRVDRDIVFREHDFCSTGFAGGALNGIAPQHARRCLLLGSGVIGIVGEVVDVGLVHPGEGGDQEESKNEVIPIEWKAGDGLLPSTLRRIRNSVCYGDMPVLSSATRC